MDCQDANSFHRTRYRLKRWSKWHSPSSHMEINYLPLWSPMGRSCLEDCGLLYNDRFWCLLLVELLTTIAPAWTPIVCFVPRRFWLTLLSVSTRQTRMIPILSWSRRSTWNFIAKTRYVGQEPLIEQCWQTWLVNTPQHDTCYNSSPYLALIRWYGFVLQSQWQERNPLAKSTSGRHGHWAWSSSEWIEPPTVGGKR